MDKKFNNKYFKVALYLFSLAASLILIYKVMDNVNNIAFGISYSLNFVWKLLAPFAIGFTIAYVLNSPIMWLENNMFKNSKIFKKEDKKRLLSTLLVYIVFIGLIILAITYIAPRVVKNVGDLINNSPDYFWKTRSFIENFSDSNQLMQNYNITEYIEGYFENFIKKYNFQHVDQIFSNIMKGVFGVTAVMLRYLLGLVISFYFLREKDTFIKVFKKFLKAILKDDTVNTLTDFGNKVDDVFSKFIIGKSIDSLIISVLCFLGLLFLNIKYALLISVIIGITNMIPYFGPFIGGVPAIIITLLDSPRKAIWIAIFIFILQQFDGMILGPKILGESTGLSPFWIIFAIIVGRGVFGIIGMFLGVPILAVLKILLFQFIDKRTKLNAES